MATSRLDDFDDGASERERPSVAVFSVDFDLD